MRDNRAATPRCLGIRSRVPAMNRASLLSGVHYLRKLVAGLPNRRPAWYFDVTEQGEGLADTGVHLVDRVHETLFPEEALNWQRDLAFLAASRWPTMVSLAQFREITGES